MSSASPKPCHNLAEVEDEPLLCRTTQVQMSVLPSGHLGSSQEKTFLKHIPVGMQQNSGYQKHSEQRLPWNASLGFLKTDMTSLSPKQGQQFCKVSLLHFPPSSRFTFTILIAMVERGTQIVTPCIAQAMPNCPDLPWESSSRERAAARNLSYGTATWIYILNHQAPTFTFSPFISTVLIIKSTPIVAPCPGGKSPWKKTRVWLNLFQEQKSHWVLTLTLFYVQNYSSNVPFPWHSLPSHLDCDISPARRLP